MITLALIGVAAVLVGALILLAESRSRRRRLAEICVAAELNRAAVYHRLWDDQDARVARMLAERAGRGWSL